MELNGRMLGFAYNMRAAKMLVDIAPERDLSRIGDALTGKHGNIIDNQAKFIIALSCAFCMSAENRGKDLEPVTMDELLEMDQETFQAVFLEAAGAFQTGQQTNVKTKPAPRKKAGPQLENQS